jgi:hypothetical protein
MTNAIKVLLQMTSVSLQPVPTLKLTQVAKNQFEITLKLYLYGKYSIQTMIFWYLCAFIWFKNIEKILLQMTSGFLQLESTIPTFLNSKRMFKYF